MSGFLCLGRQSIIAKSLKMLDTKENFTRTRETEAKTLSRSVGEGKWRNKPVINLPFFLRSQEPERWRELGEIEGMAA